MVAKLKCLQHVDSAVVVQFYELFNHDSSVRKLKRWTVVNHRDKPQLAINIVSLCWRNTHVHQLLRT